VVVGSSRCGEVVLVGAVLGVWSNRSKRGWSRLSTAAQRIGYGGGQSGTGAVKWWRRKKKGAPWWGAPLIDTRGGGRWRRGSGNRWAGKWWQQSRGRGQGGGSRCLKAVGLVRMRSARGSDRKTDTRGHAVSLLSPNCQNQLNFKNQNGCLNLLQTSLGYNEHFCQLRRHPIPNRSRVKNPVIDSTFESLINFERGLTLPEKSDKFPQKSFLT
jgi:hypothetical protein